LSRDLRLRADIELNRIDAALGKADLHLDDVAGCWRAGERRCLLADEVARLAPARMRRESTLVVL